MKKKITVFLFSLTLILILSPVKSFSQDVWIWDDAVQCKNSEGENLSFSFTNGKTSNAEITSFAYRFYNDYDVTLFIMWTAYLEDSSEDSQGLFIESGKYIQFNVPSPVKTVVVSKYEKQ
jgi:hypothetical protein